MTLDALANEIDAQAKAEAKAIIDTAKTQAKEIEDEAKSEAQSLSSEMQTRAESCLLYTSPSPRDRSLSRMPSSA